MTKDKELREKPFKVLDLYCGAGGSATGIHEAIPDAEIWGVDIKPMQSTYPFNFQQIDVLSLTKEFLQEFDFIWASPPCQLFTRAKHLREKQGNGTTALNLIPQTRELLLSSGKPFVIENVEGAPLFNTIFLCGSMFGLKVRRHRLFECSFPVRQLRCNHKEQGKPIGVYHRMKDKIPHGGTTAKDLSEARKAMGISYMNWNELKESVPPAYSKYIVAEFLKGEANKEAYAKQKQIEFAEEVLKEFGKRKYDLWSIDDFADWLEQRIKELKGEVSE